MELEEGKVDLNQKDDLGKKISRYFNEINNCIENQLFIWQSIELDAHVGKTFAVYARKNPII